MVGPHPISFWGKPGSRTEIIAPAAAAAEITASSQVASEALKPASGKRKLTLLEMVIMKKMFLQNIGPNLLKITDSFLKLLNFPKDDHGNLNRKTFAADCQYFQNDKLIASKALSVESALRIFSHSKTQGKVYIVEEKNVSIQGKSVTLIMKKEVGEGAAIKTYRLISMLYFTEATGKYRIHKICNYTVGLIPKT